MSVNDAADAAVDTWIAAMDPASANPTAVRDAMRPLIRAIYAGIGNRAASTKGTDTTIGVAAYATLLTATITSLQATSILDIDFTASGIHITNQGTTYFQVVVDGTPVKGCYTTVGIGFAFTAAISCEAAVSAGEHTVLVQWKTDAASSRILAATVNEEHAHVLVREVF